MQYNIAKYVDLRYNMYAKQNTLKGKEVFIMKTCQFCNTTLDDNAVFCTNCGNQVQASQAQYEMYQPIPDPFDHTKEFDAKDISDNKVVSMLVYLFGWIGIVIALLAAPQSPYAAFHVRQALKFTVIEILVGLIAAFTFFLIITPIAAGIFLFVLFIVKIICFFQICGGKAIEPAIIRNFTFLK